MKEEYINKLLRIVSDNYEDIALEFDLTRHKPLWPRLARLAAEVPDGSSVADIGCGNGRLIEAFKGRGIEYVGLDASHALIGLARKNYPGYDFIEGDILESGSVGKGKFDYVFCIAVIHHLPSASLRIKAWQELYSLLRPSGKMFVSAWKVWPRRKFWKYIIASAFSRKLAWNDLVFPWKGSQDGKGSLRYYHAYTKKELAKELEASKIGGFTIEDDNHNYWVTVSRD